MARVSGEDSAAWCRNACTTQAPAVARGNPPTPQATREPAPNVEPSTGTGTNRPNSISCHEPTGKELFMNARRRFALAVSALALSGGLTAGGGHQGGAPPPFRDTPAAPPAAPSR